MHHIIQHNDNDGRAAAAVVKYSLSPEEPVKFWPITYGDSVPEGIDYDNDTVYIVDFSFPVKVMEDLHYKLGRRLRWYEHHQGSLDMEVQSKVVASIDGLRAIGDSDGRPLAGCELVWKVLRPGEEQPAILTWVGDFDTWREMNGPRKFDVWAFEVGLYDMKLHLDKRYDWWHNMLTCEDDDYWENVIQGIVEKGRVSVTFERKRNRSLLHNQGFEATLITQDQNFRILAVNSNGGKLTFIDYDDPDRYQAVLKFFWAGLEQLSVGLYSDDSAFDCNKICQELGNAGPFPGGGGGHKGAGGFRTQWDHLQTFLKDPVMLKSLSKK